MKIYIAIFTILFTANTALMGAEAPGKRSDVQSRVNDYYKRSTAGTTEKAKKTNATSTTPPAAGIPEKLDLTQVARDAQKELDKPVMHMDCSTLHALGCSKHIPHCETIAKKTLDEKNYAFKQALEISDFSKFAIFKRCAIAAFVCAGADPNTDSTVADPNAPSIVYGTNALNFGVHKNDHALVRFLFEAKIDPNLRGRSYASTLFEAQDVPMVQLLTGHGTSIHIKDHGGSPLHYGSAALSTSRNPEIFKAILDAGLDPNTPIDGPDHFLYSTPLHTLAHSCWLPEHGVAQKTRYLLAAGAKVDSTDKNGKTLIDVAKESIQKAKTWEYRIVAYPTREEAEQSKAERIAACQQFIDIVRKAEAEQRRKGS